MSIVADEGGTADGAIPDGGVPTVGVTAQARPDFDPRALRVSDAEREHVASLLHKALARGLIDLDEFATRVGKALEARTRAELNAVVIDLPGVVVRIDPNGRGG